MATGTKVIRTWITQTNFNLASRARRTIVGAVLNPEEEHTWKHDYNSKGEYLI